MFDNINLLTMAPVINIQLLLDGLFIGAIFVLAAYGLALVWGVMNVKNLAQGEFVIMGGYFSWHLETLGIHPIVGLPLVIFVMFCFGWVLYLTIIRWVVTRDLFTSLLATFGIALVVQQALNLAYGPEVRTTQSGFITRSFFDGLITIADIKFISFGLCTLLAAAVIIFMKKSRMGQAIRATAQDARAAKVMGINTEKVYEFTYALNAAICGASGVMISMIWV
ncbi:MAG: branched-chain amino acid ABC transporter permease, partial [Rhodospirillales bacterium]|nr:branched-chain amino acid ABC transporter permease [Rhodospirillales bacterium]